MKKHIFVIVSLVLILTMILVSCKATETPSSSDVSSSESEKSSESSDDPDTNTDVAAMKMGDENVLVLIRTEGNGLFNGWYYKTAYDLEVSLLLSDSLVDNDKTGAIIPNALLVDKMDISDDQLNYTFTLKDNITFSDGSPMKASDVVFTFKAMLDPSCEAKNKPVASDFLGGLEYKDGNKETAGSVEFTSVEATDDKTVVVHFAENKRTNLLSLNGPILSEAFYDDIEWGNIEPSMSKNQNNPLGTGAYVIADYKPSEFVSLVKNENYFAKDETDYKIEKIIIRFGNTEIAIDEIENGGANFYPGEIDLEKVKKADASEFINVDQYKRSAYGYIDMNTAKGPFKHKAMRQALGYALDRDDFCEAQFGDLGYPIDIPMSQASSIYEKVISSGEATHYNYDPEKAKEILIEGGFSYDGDTLLDPEGSPVKLRFFATADNSVVDALIPILKINMEEIGVEIEPEFIDFNALMETVTTTDEGWDMFFKALTWNTTDPDTWKLWTPEYTPASNQTRFFNEELNTLIYDGRKILDVSSVESIETYKKVALILNDELPELPIYANILSDFTRIDVENLDTDTFMPWTKAIRFGTTVKAMD